MNWVSFRNGLFAGKFIDLAPPHPGAGPCQNPRPVVVSQTAECRRGASTLGNTRVREYRLFANGLKTSLSCARLSRNAGELKVPPRPISPEAMALLKGYSFPGNVREFRNVIARAYILSGDACL